MFGWMDEIVFLRCFFMLVRYYGKERNLNIKINEFLS